METRLLDTRTKRTRKRLWSHGRDKLPTYARRKREIFYRGPMDGTAQNAQQDSFAGWLETVLKHFKDTRKWSVRRVIAESKVNRATVYRWLDGVTPSKELVTTFCDNLGLSRVQPFAYFGWDPDAPGTPTRQDPLPPGERIQKLQAVLNDPDLLPDERAKYESLMEMIISDYEAAVERRREDGSQSES